MQVIEKKYVSDVINESGVRLLLTIIPSKYKKQVFDWITGMLDPIDELSLTRHIQSLQLSCDMV